jgi:predicted MPP superfamily phosphohydrolase
MMLFVLMIVVVYGGMHVYAFVKVKSVFSLGLLSGGLFALFLLCMVLSLFVVRWLEAAEYELPARLLAHISSLWMCLLFLFFAISVVLDAAGLLTGAAAWAFRTDLSAWRIPECTAFLLSLGLSLTATAYGMVEARSLRTERMVVETDKLPQGMDRFTIVQLSDVHLGLQTRCSRFRPMIDAVRAARPDLLVVTGDLVDAEINHLPGLAEMVREVQPPYGRYAVMGNHEYYAGVDRSLAFLREAGLTLLRDETALTGPVVIVGADDRTAGQFKRRPPGSERDLLASLPRDKFVLFLKHQPWIDPTTPGLFDLMLSGHTHQGQIYPFYHLVKLSFPFIAGTYDLGKGSLLHVSRGTGTWGPPVRLFAPPEITVCTLVRRTATRAAH